MSHRQYIGARYVPKLMDAWNSTIDYEPLSVVTDSNGNSYTSKKFVPRGTPLSDRGFWMLSGNMSGSILALQTRMNTAEGNINSLIDRMGQAESDIVVTRGILDKVRKDRKNNIVLFGDSWAVNAPTEIPAYIAKHFNATVRNYAAGGTGFDVQGGYKQQLDFMIRDINNGDFAIDDIKFCIIVCGLNDHNRGYTPEQFTQSFNEWKELYNSKFANQPIPDVYWFHNYSLENRIDVVNKTTYWDQYRYYRTIRRGVRGIKCFECFGFAIGTSDAWSVTDWRHLTSAGSTQYAENMCKSIDGALPTIYPYQIINASFDAGEVADALKPFTAKFLIQGIEMYMEINPAMGALGNLPSVGSYVTLDKFLPANPEVPREIGCGTKLNLYEHSNKRLQIAPSADTIRTAYANATGRVTKRFNTLSI